MDFDKNYENKEIPGYTPNEFANDFVVETQPVPVPGFAPIPDEYALDHSSENDANGFTDLSGLYGKDDERSDEYGGTPIDAYVVESGDDAFTYTADPSDETAATIDEYYTTPDHPDAPSAREKCELDDYEIISDVLGDEKQIVKLYSTALCEAAEEPFRNLIRENLGEAASDQYEVFEFMQKRGMYPTEQAAEEKIIEAKQQFGPLCNNCNCGNNGNNCGNN